MGPGGGEECRFHHVVRVQLGIVGTNTCARACGVRLVGGRLHAQVCIFIYIAYIIWSAYHKRGISAMRKITAPA
eukprot:1186671-Prorocentrum_minimum.AAC.1